MANIEVLQGAIETLRRRSGSTHDLDGLDSDIQKVRDLTLVTAILKGLQPVADQTVIARLLTAPSRENDLWKHKVRVPSLRTRLDPVTLRKAIALRVVPNICKYHICLWVNKCTS